MRKVLCDCVLFDSVSMEVEMSKMVEVWLTGMVRGSFFLREDASCRCRCGGSL